MGERKNDKRIGAKPQSIGGAGDGSMSYDSLVDAIHNKPLRIVKELLSQGADPNGHCKGMKFPPLCHAVVSNRPKAIDALIKAKADIEKKSKDGRTPLYLAVELGFVESVKALLCHGADVNAVNKGWSGISVALQPALQAGRIDIVKLLLAQGADVRLPKSESSDLMPTAFHFVMRAYDEPKRQRTPGSKPTRTELIEILRDGHEAECLDFWCSYKSKPAE